MATARAFRPGAPGGPARPGCAAVRRLDLADLAAPAAPPGEPLAVAAPTPARGERVLCFDEADLARACAATATAAARAAEAAAAARLDALDAASRERLAAAVDALRAELRRREETVRATLRALLGAALEALVPALREARLEAAVERVLAEASAATPAGGSLILELPEHELPTLAARVPALLAEAGFEGGFEIRPIGEGETVRLLCGEHWAEIDAAAWAASVCELVRKAIDAVPLGPSSDVEERDEREPVRAATGFDR